MAHVAFAVTNGGTLEDCHTNVFVLTELNGLKWCRFSAGSSQVFSELRDDPILNAYSQCLARSVLCVWRRLPPSTNSQQQSSSTSSNLGNYGHPHHQPAGGGAKLATADFKLNCEKELQVFWYGDEPDWQQLAVGSLTRSCDGSWETGIEYETRSLLFKALHNQIERCLLTGGYIRLGRWFVKPLNSEDTTIQSSRAAYVLAFSLSFFVHGENNVCVCVNVQRQPPVYKLPLTTTTSAAAAATTLSNAVPLSQQNSADFSGNNLTVTGGATKRQVILAPWCLKGVLDMADLAKCAATNASNGAAAAGPASTIEENRRRQVWRDWARFYPLLEAEKENDKDADIGSDAEEADRDASSSPVDTEQSKSNLLSQAIVDVTVGGVKVQYPACYVLLVSSDAANFGGAKTATPRSSSSYLMSPQRPDKTANLSATLNNSVRSASRDLVTSATSGKEQSILIASKLQQRLLDRIEEELTLVHRKPAGTGHEVSDEPTAPVVWDFAESSNPLLAPSLCAKKDACQCPMTSQQSSTSSSSHASTPGNGSSGGAGSVFGRQSPAMPFNAAQPTGLQVPNKAQLKFGLTSSMCSGNGRLRNDLLKLSKCGAFHKRTSTPSLDKQGGPVVSSNNFASSCVVSIAAMSSIKIESPMGPASLNTPIHSLGGAAANQGQTLSSANLSVPVSLNVSAPTLSSISIANGTTSSSSSFQMISPVTSSAPPLAPPNELASAAAALSSRDEATSTNNSNHDDARAPPCLASTSHDASGNHRNGNTAETVLIVEQPLGNGKRVFGRWDEKKRSRYPSCLLGRHFSKRKKRVKFDSATFLPIGSSPFDDSIDSSALYSLSHHCTPGLSSLNSADLYHQTTTFSATPTPNSSASSKKFRLWSAGAGTCATPLKDCNSTLLTTNRNAVMTTSHFVDVDVNSRVPAQQQHFPPTMFNQQQQQEFGAMRRLYGSDQAEVFRNDDNYQLGDHQCNYLVQQQQVSKEQFFGDMNNASSVQTHLLPMEQQQYQQQQNFLGQNQQQQPSSVVLMPENIMADSSSSSDSDDEHQNTFLSPPPSHGHDDDVTNSTRKSKPPTYTISNSTNIVTSMQVVESNMNNQQQKRVAAPYGVPAAVLDYGIIYPTPPSVDGATQFSPESATGAGGVTIVAQVARTDIAVAIVAGRRSPPPTLSIATVDVAIDSHRPATKTLSAGSANVPVKNEKSPPSLMVVVENPVSARYVLSGKFGPCNRTEPPHAPWRLTPQVARPGLNQGRCTTPCLEYKPRLAAYNMHNSLGHHQPIMAMAPHLAQQMMRTGHAPFGSVVSSLNFSPPPPNQALPPPPFGSPPRYPGMSHAHRHPFGSPPTPGMPASALMPPINSPMSVGGTSVMGGGGGSIGPYGASSARTPRTPGQMDLQSPLSNASSHYTNRNLGSIDINAACPSSSYAGFRLPEAHGLYVSLLLADTFVDVHKDCVFDSCPLCVCCMNVQGGAGQEYALYVQVTGRVPPDHPHQQWPSSSAKCSCGYSSVRNRYLSFKSGQFFEDEYELTGVWPAPRRRRAIDAPVENLHVDADVVQLIRLYSITTDFQLPLPPLPSLPPLSMGAVALQRSAGGRPYGAKLEALLGGTNDLNQQLLSSTSLPIAPYSIGELELGDFGELCNIALEQACLFGDGTTPTRDELAKAKSSLVHPWPFLSAAKAVNNVEAMSLIKHLLPKLQDSLHRQKGAKSAASKHSVEGPLTWRQFHRKCSHRPPIASSKGGAEDLSGPEPVPSLLVCCERELVALSPFSLRFWDRLSLEPYGPTKDVAYVAVLPDNQYLVHKARQFFRELSKTYEALRLGRHCPITRVLKDGIMRVGKTHATHLSNKVVDPWFDRFEDHVTNISTDASFNSIQSKSGSMGSGVSGSPGTFSLGQRFKLYAQVCRHYLSPHLAEFIFDRSVFRDQAKEAQQAAQTAASLASSSGSGLPADVTMPPPPAPSPSGQPTESGDSVYSDVANIDPALDPTSSEYTPPVPHAVVVYLVDAFAFGQTATGSGDDSGGAAASSSQQDNRRRSTTQALFRCFLEILRDLPDMAKMHVQMQIVPLQNILDFGHGNNGVALSDEIDPSRAASNVHRFPIVSQSDYHRQLALNVYAQSRSVGAQSLLPFQAKPLTAVGPAATRIDLIKKKTALDKCAYPLRAPLVILAPTTNQCPLDASLAPSLASCGFGALSAGTSNAPGGGQNDMHHDRMRVLFVSYCLSGRRNGQRWLLASVTDQQGTLLDTCVVNVGVEDRWCALRRQVMWEALRRLWDFLVGTMATGCHPWRLVIGRLGRIGHDELKAWAHLLNKNQLRSTSRQMRDQCGVCHNLPGIMETPCVLSACLVSSEADSHLRLFPESFSYDERFGQNAKHCPLSTPDDATCTHIMVFPTSALIQMSQMGVVSTTGMGQMDDIDEFENMNWDIPDGIDDGGLTELLCGDGGFDGGALQSRISEAPDDSIQQQPLALGYTVSTAPLDTAPDFFWSNCPSARHVLPVHMRSSLHINTSCVQQNDDQFLTAAGRGSSMTHSHPLDSSLTTDVLRYTLETYNALSWLSLEPTTGDRRSCLPLHMQALCRLYRNLERLL